MEAFSELVYLRGRSAREFQMAQQAVDPAVARPHYSMAIAYQERAREMKRRLSETDGSLSQAEEAALHAATE